MSSSNQLKVKPSSSTSLSRKPDGSSSSKGSSPSLAPKKIQSLTKLPIVDSKNKFVSKTTKSEVKPISSSKPSSKTSTKTTGKGKVTRRAKKVYSLAGQKFDPPEEREPLRIFYESLSKQIPSSEMAEFWLMERGLLSSERSKRAYEKKQMRQKQLKMGIPTKPPPRPNKPESSTRQPQGVKNPHPQAAKKNEIKSNKRITNDSDDDDFILSIKRRKG